MIPFRMGDEVEYIGAAQWSKYHIIHEVVIDTDVNGTYYFSYSTNKGAWFAHDEFKLLKKASSKSLNSLAKSLSYE